MKHFRCMLLCLSLLSAVGLMVGCSCGNPQDETTASSSAESSSAGMNESETQESSTQETTQEPTSSQGGMYESGDAQGSTGGIEDGAGSMGTDEGMLPDAGNGTGTGSGSGSGSGNGASTGNGTGSGNGTGTGSGSGSGSGTGTGDDGGLMGDVTNGLEEIGDDISNAVDDVTDGARTRSR